METIQLESTTMKLKIHLAELNRFEVIQGQNDLTYQQKPPIQTKEKDIAP